MKWVYVLKWIKKVAKRKFKEYHNRGIKGITKEKDNIFRDKTCKIGRRIIR